MKNKYFVIVLKWGLSMGLALALINFIRNLNVSEFFSISPILDLLQFIIIVGALYLGIKEIRTKLLNGEIKFGTSFLMGLFIVGTAFLVVVLYLNLQYSVIDANSINKINEKNRLKFEEKLKNKYLTQEQLQLYQHNIDSMIMSCFLYQKSIDGNDSLKLEFSFTQDFIDNCFNKLQNANETDSLRLIENAENFIKRGLAELVKLIVDKGEDRLSEPQKEVLNNFSATGVSYINDNSIYNIVYADNIKLLTIYKNSFATAMFFAGSVWIYGLLFNIFVSLYLFRKKEPVQQENEEDKNEAPLNE